MPTRHFHQKLLKVLQYYSMHLTIYILNQHTIVRTYINYEKLKYVTSDSSGGYSFFFQISYLKKKCTDF